MNSRTLSLTVASASAAALLGLAGCSTPADDTVTSETPAALTACGLDDGTVEHDALIRACDPQDTHKTTICHIPPGNPANAHTLCVGNPAVPAHMKHHGDHVGPCATETRCPPPPGHDGSQGSGGKVGHEIGGSSGTGGQTDVTGSGGAGGTGEPIVIY